MAAVITSTTAMTPTAVITTTTGITSTSNKSFQSSSEPESDVSCGNARDRYKIVDRIGEGAQGRVYLAVDKHSGRFVCIKKQVITRCAVSENIFMKMIPDDEGLCKFIEYYFEPMVGVVIVRDKAVYKTNVARRIDNVTGSKAANESRVSPDIMRARIMKHSGTNYDLHAKEFPMLRRSLSDDNLIYDANYKISPRTARCYFERTANGYNKHLNGDQTIIRGYLSAMIDLEQVPTDDQALNSQKNEQNRDETVQKQRKQEYDKNIHANAAELKEFIETEPLMLKNAPIRWEMLCIVTEYVKGPTLLNHIAESPFASEIIVARVFRMILKAVVRLHDANIVHRDLKCENIILSRSYENLRDFDRICEEFQANSATINANSKVMNAIDASIRADDNIINTDRANAKRARRIFKNVMIKHNLVAYRPKIIDFGFATSVSRVESRVSSRGMSPLYQTSIKINSNAGREPGKQETKGAKATESQLIRKCGSVHYMSPELIMNVAYDGKLNDVWALGVILFMMVFREMPFDGETRDKVIRRIIWGEYNKQLDVSWCILTGGGRKHATFGAKASPSLMKLIASMLCRADRRISARDALNSEWFIRLGMRIDQ